MSPHSFGHSLLEVLVALLVLSAGVIGAAALQLSAWQLTHQSSLHSTAQQLAAEISEWLQLVDDAALSELASMASAGTSQVMHCYDRRCDADALLRFISSDWIARARSVLPEMQVRICRDTTPWDSVAQAYRWECSSDESAPWVVKMGWFDKSGANEKDAPFVVVSTAR